MKNAWGVLGKGSLPKCHFLKVTVHLAWEEGEADSAIKPQGLPQPLPGWSTCHLPG